LRKLIWQGNNQFKLELAPDLFESPGDYDVVVKVRAVGICGTDIHILKGAMSAVKPPMVLGHEIAGEIVQVGRLVSRVNTGDRVTVDAVVGCGVCDLCSQGRVQFCANTSEFGISRDGGCQDYLVLPEKNVFRIPDTMSFEEAAILDMEVYNAVQKCSVKPEESVLVLGAGPIGLIACQVARIMGAGKVILRDVLADRLSAAEAIGMADIYQLAKKEDAVPTPSECDSVDVVIDCAGTEASTKYAMEIVRPCGRILLYGVYEHPIESIDLNQLVLKDLIVFGSQSDRTGWEEVIALTTSGALNLKSLITHTFPLEDGPRAYELVSKHESAAIKAVLQL